jgi:hypothetical protein
MVVPDLAAPPRNLPPSLKLLDAALAAPCCAHRDGVECLLTAQSGRATRANGVRFEGKIGHDAGVTPCLLMTHFGHCSTRRSGLHYAAAKHRFVMGADYRGVDLGFSRTEVFAMIYELRVYQPVPGQMPKLLARFRDELLPIWERHGIRPIGFWTTLVGNSSNELTYILTWDSLADRETRWTAFQNDPAWHKVREDSERDGPIVASISNQILTPTPFSALK